MRSLARLAHLLDIKYQLQSQAATVPVNEERIVAEVKRDILDAYRNYFSRSARDAMFQYAADLGEAKSIELLGHMDRLVKNLDAMKPQKLMNSVNQVLQLMYQMKNDPEKTVRRTIHDSVPAGNETQRNTRQRLLSKYERSISVAFSMLQRAASKLQIIVPDDIQGGSIERQRSELSKQQLLDFVLRNPAFRTYGITSLEIVEQFLSDPQLKEKLTTLINAVNRGEVPSDGSAVREFALHIKNWLDSKQK